jgi:hypothetical protein
MDGRQQLNRAMATLRCSRTALQCQLDAFDALRSEIGALAHHATRDREARLRLECVGARLAGDGLRWVDRLTEQVNQVELGMRDVDTAVRRLDARVGADY